MATANEVGRMTEPERALWLRRLIENREPESLRLDYKETLDISKDSGKKELAKDVSSFANTQGGTLIYGVPEEKDGDLPRPKPLTECGMELDSRLPERIENVLNSTVQPPLHALIIKIVDMPEIAKQLLVIQHPESYWKPHMVEGYRVGRYYRRVNFRSVIMNEREVEAAYLAREAARMHAREFFNTALFGPAYGIQIRAVACPVMPGRFKDRMLEPGFRDWLDANRPTEPSAPREGEWIPFLDGWRFVPVPKGSISGKQCEIRVFHNGAVCLNLDPNKHSLESGTLLLDALQKDLLNLFARYSATVFDGLSVNGSVVVKFWLFHAMGLKAATSTKKHRELRYIQQQIAENGVATTGRGAYIQAPDEPGQSYLDSQDMVFDEETSTDEIAERPEAFVSRLITRISTAFGLWGIEEDEA